jgi:hypothetical protein
MTLTFYHEERLPLTVIYHQVGAPLAHALLYGDESGRVVLFFYEPAYELLTHPLFG